MKNLYLIAAISLCAGCGRNDALIEKANTNKQSSRILILEESSRGTDTYTILKDKETNREYLYVDGYNSGCIIELRKD